MGWVDPRAGLDGRKISPHRDSIPEPSSPQSVAIPTELPGFIIQYYTQIYSKYLDVLNILKGGNEQQ